MQKDIINNTIQFVQTTLQNAEGGHDWFHIERVWKNTKLILQTETADGFVCELAALLHDIADSKFHNGDESIGPRLAKEFLQTQNVDVTTLDHVCNIIQYMSFKASLGPNIFTSKEMQIVQDADRLDAIGAIGIARAFNYGGFKNRKLHDPNIPIEINMDKESYKKTTAPTINHFYEKLLLLKDKMNTPTAKKIAAHRHQYMEDFLQEFYAEWDGKL